jgi:hypothetical protein
MQRVHCEVQASKKSEKNNTLLRSKNNSARNDNAIVADAEGAGG